MSEGEESEARRPLRSNWRLVALATLVLMAVTISAVPVHQGDLESNHVLRNL